MNPTAGYLHAFPMRVTPGITLTACGILPLPWSGAACSYWLGTTAADVPLLAISSEWPLSPSVVAQPSAITALSRLLASEC
jgi:hypothetical protein